MLTGIGVGVAALAGLPWIIAHLGLRRWCAQTRLARSPATDCSLRIVVPARDEAPVIEACVRSLCAVPGPEVRVCVVDDGSFDDTAELAVGAAAGDPRVSVVTAAPKPGGWAGKSWAAWTGQPGTERWLLFVDADVRIDPDLPASLVARAEADGLSLLSCFGTWDVPTLGTRWLVPAFGWLIRGLVRPERVASGEAPFANGQVLLVRRSTYLQCGGHEAVHDLVLDDVGLATSISAIREPIGVVWAPWGFRVRAYDSVAGLIVGYRKNMAAGLKGGRLGALVAAAALLFAYLGGLAVVVLGLLLANVWVVAAGAVGVALPIALRVRLERLDGRNPWIAIAHPFAGAVIAYTLLASAFGRPVAWKGRSFVDGRADDPKE